MEKLIITPTGSSLIEYAYNHNQTLYFNKIIFSDYEQPEDLNGNLLGDTIEGYILIGYKALSLDMPDLITLGYIDRTFFPSANYIVRSCGLFSNDNNICFTNLKFNNRETSVIVKLHLILENYNIDVLKWLEVIGLYSSVFNPNNRIKNLYEGKTSLIPDDNVGYVYYKIENMKIKNEVRYRTNNVDFRIYFDNAQNKLFAEEIED